MSKVLKYTVRIAAGFFLCWILLGAAAWIYFVTHKAKLTAQVNSFLNQRFLGSVHIRDIGINLWNNFPYPALQINGLTIDDTVYAPAGRHTLYMEKIRIVPGFSGLFTSHPSIRKLVLEKGGLYLNRDSSGYYNGYVWSDRRDSRRNNTSTVGASPEDRATSSRTASSFPAKIQIKDVDIVIVDSTRHKSYSFQVHRLSMDREDLSAALSGRGEDRWKTSLDVRVRSLAFNTGKGSFLQEQEVVGKGNLDFAPGPKRLSFQRLALTIGGERLLVDGAFRFDSSRLFDLRLEVPILDFRQARSWLPNNISRKLDLLHFERPFAVDARIGGKLSGGGDPKIKLRWVVRRNILSGYIGTIDDCSFTGGFDNTINPSLPASDANSLIYADSLTGKYENSIDFYTNRLEIRRLDTALMVFDLSIHNNVAPWQHLLQSTDLSFDKGRVDMDLSCRYPLSENSGMSMALRGTIQIKDAEISYLPRAIKISDGQVNLAFDHQDLVISQISGKIGRSPVKLTGNASHFLAFANADTGRMILDWKLYSSSLDLGSLLPFLGHGSSRRASAKRAETAADGAAGNRAGAAGMLIDRYIRRCQVYTQLQIDRLTCNNFTAEQVAAGIKFSNGVLSLSKASLQTAKGNVTLSGTLSNEGEEENRVKLHAVLTQLDLSTLFYSFDNFGQQSLGSRNLAGLLNARTDLSMRLTNKGKKIPGSLEGSLDFTIDKGALLNFSPLLKLSNFALKNRDLSHVYFSRLHDLFVFSKDTAVFDKMEIQSSVLEMFVEGVYKLDGEYTDADIQVPLLNLKKRKGIPKNVGVDAKHGLSIYVHAYNTGKEPLHYRLGLFKKKIRSPHSFSDYL